LGLSKVVGVAAVVGLAFAAGWSLGHQVGLSDLLGDVVVVDFWTTWCGPCRLQAEILEDLYAEVSNQGVQFLAVSVAEEAEIVRDFVADQPFKYPVLLDSQEKLSEPLGIFAFPTVMIVDRQGQVAYLRAGISLAETLRQELRGVGVDLG
jgi:thiol-disulfide isomerase/thioredoxin